MAKQFKANDMKLQMQKIAQNTLLMLMVVFLFSACATKVAFLNSAIVPSAEGTVSIKQGKNNNYDIDLTVDRLAEPERLTPPKSIYVVWMETSQSGIQNIGQLQTASRGLSNMLTS